MICLPLTAGIKGVCHYRWAKYLIYQAPNRSQTSALNRHLLYTLLFLSQTFTELYSKAVWHLVSRYLTLTQSLAPEWTSLFQSSVHRKLGGASFLVLVNHPRSNRKAEEQQTSKWSLDRTPATLTNANSQAARPRKEFSFRGAPNWFWWHWQRRTMAAYKQWILIMWG